MHESVYHRSVREIELKQRLVRNPIESLLKRLIAQFYIYIVIASITNNFALTLLTNTQVEFTKISTVQWIITVARKQKLIYSLHFQSESINTQCLLIYGVVLLGAVTFCTEIEYVKRNLLVGLGH